MIGVFDSGFGGLTVLKSFLRYCPDYSYIYLGDNARVPYGGKSKELIYEYAKQAVDFLFKNDCQLIIFACNTVSALALRKIQQEYLPKNYPDKKVLGVVRPIVEDIVDCDIKNIGVIGTRATIRSNVYEKEIRKLGNSEIKIEQVSTPLLVPLIEENYNNKIVVQQILEDYLAPLRKKKIARLVLACTHYPLLINDIQQVIGSDCIVRDPSVIVAKKLNNYLEKHNELKFTNKNKGNNIIFYTTDDVKKFKELAKKILGQKMKNTKCPLGVNKINL